jgi:DUF4097 and DUF4098 domain-containing protein YvlB
MTGTEDVTEFSGSTPKALLHHWRVTAALLAVTVGLPLWAQQSRVYQEGNSWVEEITGTLPPGRQVHVNTDVGSVKMQGNSQACTYVVRKRSYAANQGEARRQFEQFRFNAVRTGEIDALQGRLSNRNMGRFGVEMAIQVPRAEDLVKVETGAGSLVFSMLSGTVVGVTGGGAVKLDDLSGPVKIKSGGGDVTGGNLGADLTLTSGGGDIRIESVAGQSRIRNGGGRVTLGFTHGAEIQSDGGGVDVRKCAGDLHAETGGGNIDIGDVSGTVRATTTGGTLRIASATGRVEASTGGGSVEMRKLGQGAQIETGAGAITVEFIGGRSTFNDSNLHTAAGDVVVYLPGNLPVTIHASTDMATSMPGIRSDFQALAPHTEGGNFGPRSAWAEGQLNGGGALLRVRTTIGQIDFRRLQ